MTMILLVMMMHIFSMESVLSSCRVVGEDVSIIGVGVIVNLAGTSPSTTLNDSTSRSDTSTSEKRLEVPARSLRSLTNPSGSLLMEASAMVPRSGGVHAGPLSPGREGGRYSPVITTEKSKALDEVGRRR